MISRRHSALDESLSPRANDANFWASFRSAWGLQLPSLAWLAPSSMAASPNGRRAAGPWPEGVGDAGPQALTICQRANFDALERELAAAARYILCRLSDCRLPGCRGRGAR